MNNIFFRVDASVNIGTGHVVRCLTLADGLKHEDVKISFICREDPGNLTGLVRSKGFDVYKIPAGIDMAADCRLALEILKGQSSAPDWLIVDHYGIDASYETMMRQAAGKIMAIDDLADRRHDCDILLDQTYSSNNDRYRELLPSYCARLLGPKYALLRPQFLDARDNLRQRDGQIKRIFICMGGVDFKNLTCKALRAIKTLNRPGIHTDVVIGASNFHRVEVEALASEIPNVRCFVQVEEMAELMAAADLGIGAGGTTIWERSCLGLPSLVVITADNQIAVTRELSQEGYLVSEGWFEEVNEQDLCEDIGFLCRHPEIMKQISLKAKQLVDGRGAERVRNYLLNNFDSKRPGTAVADDRDTLVEK